MESTERRTENTGTIITPWSDWRFCVNCKWCDQSVPSFECTAPQNFTERMSLVTGGTERIPKAKYCETQRSTNLDNRCGISGRWHEQRQAEAAE